MAKIMITDNGPHPPEKWAMTTAETIFDTGSLVSVDRQLHAKKLQVAIAEALLPHHTNLQVFEKQKLKDDISHIHSAYSHDLDTVMADIIAASKNTFWETHFAKEEVQAAVRDILTNHFSTSQHIERLWHADIHPDCPVSQQYKAKFHS
jgi:hypothetical protein